MSLQTTGKLLMGEETPRPDNTDQVGIPGSRRFALFYQDGRQLPVVEHGKGIHIWDNQGKRYIDGCSGAFAANIGHGHPRIAERTHQQLEKIAFAYRTQFQSEPADELADLLVRLSPPTLDRVFLVNSGSEAVETAIKLARQFWWATGREGKNLVISRRPSYHGATLGALSCTDYAPLNIPFRAMQLRMPKVSAPFCYHCPLGKRYPRCSVACAFELEQIIDIEGSNNIAAFIAEPIGGATTGAAVPPDEYFPIVEKICHDHGVLLIIDDVLTGCGRTGTFYGFEHWAITPDIVVISKGLSGGYTPIGACLSSEQVVEPVLKSGGFMHGHTYAGNPLSAAIASEVVKIIVDEGLVENAREMGTYLHRRLRTLKGKFRIIGDIRGRGLLAGVEFVLNRRSREPFPANWYVAHEATEIARDEGLLVYPRRPLSGLKGDHVVIAPPLVVDRTGVDELIGLFRRTLQRLTEYLDEYLAPKVAVEEDETIERFHLPDEVPDYALGNIDEVKPVPNANVTWTMQDPDLEVHGSGPDEESEPNS